MRRRPFTPISTANPIANSSGSVTNHAIQVLQGSYITNTYGSGIQCQGPTMNLTPYANGSVSYKKPFESIYLDPVYNNADNDDDNIPDNPGQILYEIPTRTNQKDNYSLSLGFSATWSKPLDKDLIWQLATTHEAIMTIEEGAIGGFGSHVVDFLSKKGLMDSNLKFRSMTLPDIFIDQDTPDNMYKIANLDSSSTEEKVLDVLNSNIVLQKQK